MPRVGFKHSEETRKKMSITRSGKKFSEEHKRNIRESCKGINKKKKSEITKLKISISRKGKCLGNSNGFRSGIKPWNYIEDRNKLAKKQERNDSAYKEWRRLVRNRDGWKCQIANEECYGKVVAHHILSWSYHEQLRYEVKNGITLCHFHHPRKRNDEIKLAPIFQEIVLSRA